MLAQNLELQGILAKLSEDQPHANFEIMLIDASGQQLKHALRIFYDRAHPPRLHCTYQIYDMVICIKKNNIYRIAHKTCMDAVAGIQPDRFILFRPALEHPAQNSAAHGSRSNAVFSQTRGISLNYNPQSQSHPEKDFFINILKKENKKTSPSVLVGYAPHQHSLFGVQFAATRHLLQATVIAAQPIRLTGNPVEFLFQEENSINDISMIFHKTWVRFEKILPYSFNACQR